MLLSISFSSVLDVGCGEGISLLQACLVSPSSRFAGFDLDRERVKIRVESVSVADLFVADDHHIPLDDKSFDVVLCLEALEHVGEPLRSIAEIARVTKRYALFSVPNEPWWHLSNMARLKDFGNTPGHINHWTVNGFKKIITSKFEILQSRRLFLWNFVLVEKLLRD